MKKVLLLAILLSLAVPRAQAFSDGERPVNACGLVLGGVNDVVVSKHLDDRQAAFQFLTVDYPYLFTKSFIDGFFKQLSGRDFTKLARAEQDLVVTNTTQSLEVSPNYPSFPSDVLRQAGQGLTFASERVEISSEAIQRYQQIPQAVVKEVIRDVLIEKYAFYKAVNSYFTKDASTPGRKWLFTGKVTAGTTIGGIIISLGFFHSELPIAVGLLMPAMVRGVADARLRITHWLQGRTASQIMSLDNFRLSNSYAALLKEKNVSESQRLISAPRTRSTDTVSLDYIRNIVPVADVNNPKTIIELGEDIERGVHLFSNDLNLRSLQRQTAPTLLKFKEVMAEAIKKAGTTGKTPTKLRVIEDIIGDSLRNLQTQAKFELDQNIQLQEAQVVLKDQFVKHQLYVQAMQALPEVSSREQVKVLVDDKAHELDEFLKTLNASGDVLEQEQLQILGIRKVATRLILYMTQRLSQVNSLDILPADYDQLRSVQEALKNL